MDDENIGLKAKKKSRKRAPQNRPKGPPEGDLKESASHHNRKKVMPEKPTSKSPNLGALSLP